MTGPAPETRRTGLLRSAKAFWHPHIALMLPLGFCMSVPLGWSFFVLPVLLWRHDTKDIIVAALAVLSWVSILSFFWAPVFDKLQLPWLADRLGRRRSWMLITHIACMAAIVTLGIFAPSARLGTVLLLVGVVALASSSLSAVANAYRIELLEQGRYGAGIAVTQLGAFLAAVAVRALIASPEDMDEGAIAHLAAPGLLLAGVAVALFGPEPSQVPDPGAAAREHRLAATAARWGGAVSAWTSRMFAAPLTEFFTRPAWLAVLAFLLLFELSAAGLKPGTTSWVFPLVPLILGMLAGGMAVYARGPLPSLLFATCLLLLMNAVVLSLAWASAEPVWIGFALLVGRFAGGFGIVALAAYAMGLCRPSYTATQFALFSAVMALAQTTPGPRSWLDGLLGETLNVTFLSVTASLLSLLLLRVLWKRRGREEARP